jgi:hypothetical protein
METLMMAGENAGDLANLATLILFGGMVGMITLFALLGTRGLFAGAR